MDKDEWVSPWKTDDSYDQQPVVERVWGFSRDWFLDVFGHLRWCSIGCSTGCLRWLSKACLRRL